MYGAILGDIIGSPFEFDRVAEECMAYFYTALEYWTNDPCARV